MAIFFLTALGTYFPHPVTVTAQVHSSAVFRVFRESSTRHQQLILEHFQHPQKKAHALQQSFGAGDVSLEGEVAWGGFVGSEADRLQRGGEFSANHTSRNCLFLPSESRPWGRVCSIL